MAFTNWLKQFKFWHSDTDTAPKFEIKHKTMKTHTYKYKINSKPLQTAKLYEFYIENATSFTYKWIN